MPDCVSWDGIAQCDSRGRFHRSQVFGEPSRNPAMDMRPAMSPLTAVGCQAGGEGHTAAPLLWMGAVEEEMPQGKLRVGTVFGKEISKLCSLPDQPASRGKLEFNITRWIISL